MDQNGIKSTTLVVILIAVWSCPQFSIQAPQAANGRTQPNLLPGQHPVYTCSVVHGLIYNSNGTTSCTDKIVNEEYCSQQGFGFNSTSKTCQVDGEATLKSCSITYGVTFNVTENACTTKAVDSDYCFEQGLNFDSISNICTYYKMWYRCVSVHGLQYSSGDNCRVDKVDTCNHEQGIPIAIPVVPGGLNVVPANEKSCGDSYCLSWGMNFDPISIVCTNHNLEDTCRFIHGFKFNYDEYTCSDTEVDSNYCHKLLAYFDQSSRICSRSHENDPVYTCSAIHGFTFNQIDETCTDIAVDWEYCRGQELRFDPSSYKCTSKIFYRFQCSHDYGLTFDERGCTDRSVDEDYCSDHDYGFDHISKICIWSAQDMKERCLLVHGLESNANGTNCKYGKEVDGKYCHQQGFRFDPSSKRCIRNFDAPIYDCNLVQGFVTFNSTETECTDIKVDRDYCLNQGFRFDPSSRKCTLDKYRLYTCIEDHGLTFESDVRGCTDIAVDKDYCSQQNYNFDSISKTCTYFDIESRCHLVHGLTFNRSEESCTNTAVDKNYCSEYNLAFNFFQGVCQRQYFNPIDVCNILGGFTYDPTEKRCTDEAVDEMYCLKHGYDGHIYDGNGNGRCIYAPPAILPGGSRRRCITNHKQRRRDNICWRPVNRRRR